MRWTRRRVLAAAWVVAITIGVVQGLQKAPRGDPRWSTTADCGTNLWPQCATRGATVVSYTLLIGGAALLLGAIAWRVESGLADRRDPTRLRSPPRWTGADGRRYVALPVFVVAMVVAGVYFLAIRPARYDSAYVRRLTDGFGQREAFGIDVVEPDRARARFSSILRDHYHVPPDEADCMATHAFGEGDPTITTRPTVVFGPRASYHFDADELNALAFTCRVDFSDLWYMTD